MILPFEFHRELERNGLTFFTGVPDSLLKDLCAYITDHVPPQDHVINANEGGAVALAAGYHLATGKMAGVYLQNSGLGNAINPLLSLADPGVYGIPMLLLAGWRGEPGVPDEPQHVTQGRVMPGLLEAIGMPYDVIGPDTDDYPRIVRQAVEGAVRGGRPHMLLTRKGTFAAYSSEGRSQPPFTRPEAIEILLGNLHANDLVVSTTGMTSREVFAYRERHGQAHDRDFLTVGSMGHASQIALGVAAAQADRQVFCLDGDGAAIMHMGSLAIIGTQQPARLKHVVINNGAHDSVGGQPTAARQVDLSAVALACGYRSAKRVSSEAELTAAIPELRAANGPSFLEVAVASQTHTEAGRPTTTPHQNKRAFMRALGHESG